MIRAVIIHHRCMPSIIPLPLPLPLLLIIIMFIILLLLLLLLLLVLEGVYYNPNRLYLRV
jgi:hypothetical protein